MKAKPKGSVPRRLKTSLWLLWVVRPRGLKVECPGKASGKVFIGELGSAVLLCCRVGDVAVGAQTYFSVLLDSGLRIKYPAPSSL